MINNQFTRSTMIVEALHRSTARMTIPTLKKARRTAATRSTTLTCMARASTMTTMRVCARPQASSNPGMSLAVKVTRRTSQQSGKQTRLTTFLKWSRISRRKKAKRSTNDSSSLSCHRIRRILALATRKTTTITSWTRESSWLRSRRRLCRRRR